MSKMGRPKAVLKLAPEEREVLERFVRRRTLDNSLVMRARIVLRCAAGLDNTDVAEEPMLDHVAYREIRARFRQGNPLPPASRGS